MQDARFVYREDMAALSDVLTLTIPRSMVPALPVFAESLNERMHELLEKNTEGTLPESERVELESLVQMAQFAQILSMAAQDHAA